MSLFYWEILLFSDIMKTAKQEEKAVADSSKDIQLRELKDMITDLKKMIKTLQATVDAANKREEALTQERDNLKDEVALLRKKLFGSSSEKRTLDIQGQLNLFNEAEMEQDPAAAKAEELEASLPDKAGKKRKARTTDAERFKGIPVQKKYLDLDDGERVCPVCNTALEEIGEEFVRRELVFIPAKLKVYEYYSKNYTCPECSKRDLPVIKKGAGISSVSKCCETEYSALHSGACSTLSISTILRSL